MAITTKLLCLSVSALLFLQMINASRENAAANNKETIEKAPFVKNVNTILNHRVTKMAKNALDLTKDYVVQYGEDWVDKMNENHAKKPYDPNSLTPNLIKHNLVDPTKAFSQVSFRKLSHLGSKINEAYKEYDKPNENEKPSPLKPIKRLASKPFALGLAAVDVFANSAANFMNKISVDDNSKENKDNQVSKETQKPRKTAERIKKI